MRDVWVEVERSGADPPVGAALLLLSTRHAHPCAATHRHTRPLHTAGPKELLLRLVEGYFPLPRDPAAESEEEGALSGVAGCLGVPTWWRCVARSPPLPAAQSPYLLPPAAHPPTHTHTLEQTWAAMRSLMWPG